MPRKRQRGPQSPHIPSKSHTYFGIIFQKQAGKKTVCYNPSKSGIAVHFREAVSVFTPTSLIPTSCVPCAVGAT